jgi:hypothetical protein
MLVVLFLSGQPFDLQAVFGQLRGIFAGQRFFGRVGGALEVLFGFAFDLRQAAVPLHLRITQQLSKTFLNFAADVFDFAFQFVCHDSSAFRDTRLKGNPYAARWRFACNRRRYLDSGGIHMAEIHVEKKSGPGAWVWVLVALIVLAAVGFFLWQAGYINLGGGASNIVEEVSMIAGGFHGA